MCDDVKKNIAMLNNRAFELSEEENYVEAAECCSKALALCASVSVPDSMRARILFNKAMVFIKMGEVDRGTEILKTASDLVPEDAAFLTDCGLLCYNNQCFCEAGFYYNLAERTGQLGGALLNNIGVLNFTNGEYESARNYFERATEADRGSLDAWFNLADTYEILGENEKAEAARKVYLELEKEK